MNESVSNFQIICDMPKEEMAYKGTSTYGTFHTQGRDTHHWKATH